MVKTRVAPSPTGFLHVGNLRSALFSYLYAKKYDGTFFIRVEDTDQGRFVEGAIENMLQSLHWVGITPDEGVDLVDSAVIQKGENGPYIQSERLTIYQEHTNILLEKDHAYHCFCTKERLEEVRAIQEANKQPVGYDGFCRNLTDEEVAQAKAEGKVFVIRMKMPKEGTTTFADLVRGNVSFENRLIDDQVLVKSDGFPTYHLAATVDDHLMRTTHVIRGEEWLPSTPKHIMLYQMFGWDVPTFAHLSLLVNEQKKKLSKRHGDVSVEDFKEKGYLPEALVNFIAFLGWNPGDEREIFSLDELKKEFSFEKVSKAAAVFNREKLDWYNKQYMMKMDLDELTARAVPFFVNAGHANLDVDQLRKVVALERERSVTLKELVEAVAFFFAETLVFDAELAVWKKDTREGTKEKLGKLVSFLKTTEEGEWEAKKLEETLMNWIKEQGYGVGDILWPMRVSLSGQKNSPGPFDIADVLGKEKTITRIQTTAAKL